MIGLLAGMLPQMIRWAEQLITKPKGGVDRKDMVRQMSRAALEKLAAVEGATTQAPTDPEIDGAIQIVFDQMRQSGALTAPAVERVSLLLVRGDVQVIPMPGGPK